MYKSKHTGEQVDRLLKDVFDSTLQTKDIDVTENGVIEVTPDEGYLGLAKVNVNVSAGGGNSGGELEGEYFLTRPNGWYWRIPYVNDYRIFTSNTQDYNAYSSFVQWLKFIAYDGYFASSSGKHTYRDIFDIIDHCVRTEIKDSLDENIALPMTAFRERDELTLSELPGHTFSSFFELFKFLLEMEDAGNMSDEEILSLMSDTFKIERISKEEYEALEGTEYK